MTHRRVPPHSNRFQLLEVKSTIGRFKPQMETKSPSRLHSQTSAVMRMSEPGEETTAPVIVQMAQALSQRA